MRGVFVAGTGTGVGKSVLAAALCALLAARGQPPAAFKPAVTGLDDPPSPDWPPDHELLAAAAGGGLVPDEVSPYRFGPPLSPHYAAELADELIDPGLLVERARAAGARAGTLVCEGVGGLMVPLTSGYLVRDLAVDLGLPLVIAASTGLGTINHTVLTVEAARAAGLRVAGVVMTPWPASPSGMERSNRSTVECLAAVAVHGLPPTDPATLAAAASELPLEDWLGP